MCNERENFTLALGQIGKQLVWSSRSRCAEVLYQPLRDGRAKDRFATTYHLDRTHGFLSFCSLQQVASCSGPHRCKDRVIVIKHRQDEDADMRGLCKDTARRLNAVDARHIEIHEDHIWLERQGFLNSFRARRGLADHRGGRLC